MANCGGPGNHYCVIQIINIKKKRGERYETVNPNLKSH